MVQFTVNDKRIRYEPLNDGNAILVRSVPRSYEVLLRSSGQNAPIDLCRDILAHPCPMLLIDRWVWDTYFRSISALEQIPRFVVSATEENKCIDTVINIIAFLENCGVSKATMLFAVGGGIVQDLAAFSAYIYKRGIPWTYVPTTLLGQGDSCVGGKTALNHHHTKNLLALFSAPRKVIADTGFLITLADEDWLSGGGEILRLCITGGEASLREFEQSVRAFLKRDPEAVARLIGNSLGVKKSVVEFDEFELNIRRSMNYGHSFGHALEALTDYRIGHGVGVTLGMLVENEVSYQRRILAKSVRNRILALANKIISDGALDIFLSARLDGILALLKRDKKAEDSVLKVATLAKVGKIDFIDLPLDAAGETEVRLAYANVTEALSALRHA